MRTLNTAAQALRTRAMAGESIPVVQLVEIHLATVWRLACCGVPLEWAGHTWAATGLTVGAVESELGEFVGVTVTLPGATESQLALAFDEDLEGATLRVYEAWVDPDTAEVADAPLAWAGALETPVIEDGPTAAIGVQAEHRGAIAVRPKPSRYTHDEQQRLFAGDTSLDFDPATDAAPLAWPAASYFKQ